MVADLRREGIELDNLKVENTALQDGGVERPSDLVDVDPDPPELALDADERHSVGRSQLGATMKPTADQRDRPLGARSARIGGCSLQQAQVIYAQPQGQLGTCAGRGGLRAVREAGLRRALDQPTQQAGPTAVTGRRRIETAGQVGREANGEAVHEGGRLSDNAGAKPILP